MPHTSQFSLHHLIKKKRISISGKIMDDNHSKYILYAFLLRYSKSLDNRFLIAQARIGLVVTSFVSYANEVWLKSYLSLHLLLRHA